MNGTLMLMCMAGSLTVGQPEKPAFQAPNIEVMRGQDHERDGKTFPFSYLMYNRVYMARQYDKPKERSDYGKPNIDFSRLSTTYFHDASPIGLVLGKFDWFPGKRQYRADVRLPASMVGIGMLPLAGVVQLWSEPPVAVLGMDAGTLASYARPTQVMHFTERVPVFVKLSLPGKDEKRYFHFVQDARDRGAIVKVFEGEPREVLEKHGGERFYQVIVIESYKLPVVEVHKELMTKEALTTLMGKLREEGILCFHTSNRYYDLAPVVLAAADALGFAAVLGKSPYFDRVDGIETSHRFSSDWVMVARKKEYLAHLREPEGFKANFPGQELWSSPEQVRKRLLWTDKGENSFRSLYRSDPSVDALSESLWRVEKWLNENTPLANAQTSRTLQPVHGAIRAWSKRSADYLNRELPKKDVKNEAKK